ncbi:hypothetical protein D3C85_1501220 [compost metagenome]
MASTDMRNIQAYSLTTPEPQALPAKGQYNKAQARWIGTARHDCRTEHDGFWNAPSHAARFDVYVRGERDVFACAHPRRAGHRASRSPKR